MQKLTIDSIYIVANSFYKGTVQKMAPPPPNNSYLASQTTPVHLVGQEKETKVLEKREQGRNPSWTFKGGRKHA